MVSVQESKIYLERKFTYLIDEFFADGSRQIGALKRRVAWLESIVRERCPDIDLALEPDDTADTTAVNESHVGLGVDETMRDSVSAAPERPTSTLSGQVVSTNPSHEIGLLSLGINQEARYIGPSSGYFLARVMLTKGPTLFASRDAALPSELVEAVQGELPLPPRALAKRLCDAYFDVLHPQYPILHEPTIITVVDQMYVGQVAPASEFQVYMVFALGAVALGSLGLRIPGESYCLSAMKHFEQINIENSVQGLQCLLLLLLFSIHSPSVRLNAWYLNYQCIAAVLDLGLQRDITTASGISLLEQEMRTRIFWVVMMLDRTICTMMGRPIGIRDEACELRVSVIVHD